jgi:hypothetical protein
VRLPPDVDTPVPRTPAVARRSRITRAADAASDGSTR